MSRPLIWVFGNAVQDITVEVDIDTLIRDNASLIGSIALKDTALIKEGALFTTHFNGQGFGVQLHLETPSFSPKEAADLYSLSPGEKYTLEGRVQDLAEREEWLADPNAMMVHCEDVSWGGGGINMCRFLRALAPSGEQPAIRYTDYGMSSTFEDMVKMLQDRLLRTQPPEERESIKVVDVTERVATLMKSSSYKGEELISNISDLFAKYSPDRCLEVFLASLLIDPLLFRPKDPVFLRNWVFSNVRNAQRSTQDKIICRSKAPNEAALGVAPEILDQFLADGDNDSVGAMVLNSIKHEQMFKSAYDLYRRLESKRRKEKRNDFVGVLAMTMAMQKFAPYMLDAAKADGGFFPPFILIFNEEEAVEFAKALGTEVPPIIRVPGDLPNVLNFARVVEAIRLHFQPPYPRIYVTIGARGSLGWDGESSQIIHVSYYSRLGDILFDTNGCGDAYCAAITLLEWSKRCHGGNVGPKNPPAEMRYFMSVATAAAYCKARDRRGRIDSKTIRALLEDTYLGSGEVGLVDQILQGIWDDKKWIDSEGRAHRPPEADFRGVTSTLTALFSTRLKVGSANSGSKRALRRDEAGLPSS